MRTWIPYFAPSSTYSHRSPPRMGVMTGFRRKRSARKLGLPVRINQGAGSTHLLHLGALGNGRIGGLGHGPAFAESTGERPLWVEFCRCGVRAGRSGPALSRRGRHDAPRARSTVIRPPAVPDRLGRPALTRPPAGLRQWQTIADALRSLEWTGRGNPKSAHARRSPRNFEYRPRARPAGRRTVGRDPSGDGIPVS